MSYILNTIEKIRLYKIFKLNQILDRLGLSKRQYYYIKKAIKITKVETRSNIKKVISINKITDTEKEAVIKYALSHTGYRHRELTYRMIDENIAYLSESSVYRVLKEANLVQNYKRNHKYGWIHKYSNYASKPDELWQTDITYLKYKLKEVYLLSFIDVYSRYIVLSVLMSNMESDTVSEIFEKYYEKNKTNLKNKPRIQSDNGSCYVGWEFKQVMDKYMLGHDRIHPGTPTENIIIERWHRTFKEILMEQEEPKNYEELFDKIKKTVYYYNYKRYHSALGYMPPIMWYRGEPEKLFRDRKEKLYEARKRRKDYYLGTMLK